jgi:hypothetical protein
VQQGTGANNGRLVIALATGTGLVAAQGEPISYWLARETVPSTEINLMKASVQQAAVRLQYSIGGSNNLPLQFISQFGVLFPYWNKQMCMNNCCVCVREKLLSGNGK